MTCPSCRSRLVQPVEIEPADQGLCRVVRRCPECEWCGAGAFAAAAVAHFEAALEAASASLEAMLRALERAHMAADVECFARAVAAGDVLPEDF
jgi:hypothetical protein